LCDLSLKLQNLKPRTLSLRKLKKDVAATGFAAKSRMGKRKVGDKKFSRGYRC
jgi:hypothetical protein